MNEVNKKCDEKDVCNTYNDKGDCDCDMQFRYKPVTRRKSKTEIMVDKCMENLTNVNIWLNDMVSGGKK